MDPYLVGQAQEAAARELSLPFKTAVRNYYPGMFWSCMLSLALVMEGYDVGMVSTVLCKAQDCREQEKGVLKVGQ